jgi:general secretion pathway protein H
VRRGFTLLELLVVVALIAIIAGIAVLSLDLLGDDRELEREAYRLRGLLTLLREEALLQNRDYGVAFTETGYRFYIYDPAQFLWFDAQDDRLLAHYELTEPLSLEMRLDDRQVRLERYFDEEFLAMPEPQLLLLATGEQTPFEIGFYRDFSGGRFRLVGDFSGEIEIRRSGFDDA